MPLSVADAIREFRASVDEDFDSIQHSQGQVLQKWESLRAAFISEWRQGLQHFSFQEWASQNPELQDRRLLRNISILEHQDHYQALQPRKRSIVGKIIHRLHLDGFWELYFSLGSDLIASRRALELLLRTLKRLPDLTLSQIIPALRIARDKRVQSRKRGTVKDSTIFTTEDVSFAFASQVDHHHDEDNGGDSGGDSGEGTAAVDEDEDEDEAEAEAQTGADSDIETDAEQRESHSEADSQLARLAHVTVKRARPIANARAKRQRLRESSPMPATPEKGRRYPIDIPFEPDDSEPYLFQSSPVPNPIKSRDQSLDLRTTATTSTGRKEDNWDLGSTGGIYTEEHTLPQEGLGGAEGAAEGIWSPAMDTSRSDPTTKQTNTASPGGEVSKGSSARALGSVTSKSLMDPTTSQSAIAHLWPPDGTLLIGRTPLNAADMATLDPGCWVNDNIINAYGEFLKTQEGGSRISIQSSFFYSRLTGGIGSEKTSYDAIKPWMTKQQIFNYQHLAIPVNHRNKHWTLAIITNLPWYKSLIPASSPVPKPPIITPKSSIITIDSLDRTGSTANKEISSHLRAFIVQQALCELGVRVNPLDVLWFHGTNLPLQSNGFDCGIWVMLYLQELVHHTERFFDILGHGKILDLDITDDRRKSMQELFDGLRRPNLTKAILNMESSSTAKLPPSQQGAVSSKASPAKDQRHLQEQAHHLPEKVFRLDYVDVEKLPQSLQGTSSRQDSPNDNNEPFPLSKLSSYISPSLCPTRQHQSNEVHPPSSQQLRSSKTGGDAIPRTGDPPTTHLPTDHSNSPSVIDIPTALDLYFELSGVQSSLRTQIKEDVEARQVFLINRSLWISISRVRIMADPCELACLTEDDVLMIDDSERNPRIDPAAPDQHQAVMRRCQVLKFRKLELEDLHKLLECCRLCLAVLATKYRSSTNAYYEELRQLKAANPEAFPDRLRCRWVADLSKAIADVEENITNTEQLVSSTEACYLRILGTQDNVHQAILFLSTRILDAEKSLCMYSSGVNSGVSQEGEEPASKKVKYDRLT